MINLPQAQKRNLVELYGLVRICFISLLSAACPQPGCGSPPCPPSPSQASPRAGPPGGRPMLQILNQTIQSNQQASAFRSSFSFSSFRAWACICWLWVQVEPFNSPFKTQDKILDCDESNPIMYICTGVRGSFSFLVSGRYYLSFRLWLPASCVSPLPLHAFMHHVARLGVHLHAFMHHVPTWDTLCDTLLLFIDLPHLPWNLQNSESSVVLESESGWGCICGSRTVP